MEIDDGASLFHLDWGTGKPVLFTHARALNAHIWEHQLTELVDQGMRVVDRHALPERASCALMSMSERDARGPERMSAAS